MEPSTTNNDAQADRHSLPKSSSQAFFRALRRCTSCCVSDTRSGRSTSDARSLACRTASRVQSQASDRTSSVATEQSSSMASEPVCDETRFGGSRHARGEGAVEK